MSLVKQIQSNDFNDNILTSLDSITYDRNLLLHEETVGKKLVDDELDKNFAVRKIKDNAFNDKMLTNIDSVVLNREPTTKNGVVKKLCR